MTGLKITMEIDHSFTVTNDKAVFMPFICNGLLEFYPEKMKCFQDSAGTPDISVFKEYGGFEGTVVSHEKFVTLGSSGINFSMVRQIIDFDLICLTRNG